jgi:hypothetical protein
MIFDCCGWGIAPTSSSAARLKNPSILLHSRPHQDVSCVDSHRSFQISGLGTIKTSFPAFSSFDGPSKLSGDSVACSGLPQSLILPGLKGLRHVADRTLRGRPAFMLFQLSLILSSRIRVLPGGVEASTEFPRRRIMFYWVPAFEYPVSFISWVPSTSPCVFAFCPAARPMTQAADLEQPQGMQKTYR